MKLEDLFDLIEELYSQKGITFEMCHAGFGKNLVQITLSKHNYCEYDDYGNPVKYKVSMVFNCKEENYFKQFVSQMVELLDKAIKQGGKE
jgi:hypothetical protein